MKTVAKLCAALVAISASNLVSGGHQPAISTEVDTTVSTRVSSDATRATPVASMSAKTGADRRYGALQMAAGGCNPRVRKC
jgi:hypothetical protein